MIDQAKLLLLLMSLFLGVGVIGFIYQRMRLYNSLYLKNVLKYTVITNIILFIFFLSKYFEINIWQKEIQVNTPEYLPFIFSLVYLGLFLLMYVMFEIFEAFHGEKLTKKKQLIIYITIVVVILLIYVLANFVVNTQYHSWVWFIFDNLAIIFPIYEIVILTKLYFTAKNSPNKKRIVKSFALLYGLRYPFFLSIIVIPHPVRLFLIVLVIHLLPVLWIKRHVDKEELVSGQIDNIEKRINRLAHDYSISSREKEILLQIFNGKNNKEIGEKLFISYHTVKNHIYNLYKKLNVSNRYQLMTLIKKFDNF